MLSHRIIDAEVFIPSTRAPVIISAFKSRMDGAWKNDLIAAAVNQMVRYPFPSIPTKE